MGFTSAEINNLFSTVFLNNPSAMSVTTASEGRIIEVNQSFLKLMGYQREELIGKTTRNLYMWPDIDRRNRRVRMLIKNGAECNEELELRTKTGELKHFLVSTELIEVDGVSCALGMGVDITARKITEEQLKIQQEILSRTNSDLHQAKRIAEEANMAKSEFLANTSHEIRTPLTVIMGLSELALKEDCPDATRIDFLKRIMNNAQYLGALIDDVLDLAKIEAKKLQVEQIRFSLSHVLEEVITTMEKQARTKSLEFECDLTNVLPVTIVSDPIRLRQILTNILGNAIKFTPAGKIHVKAKWKEGSDGSLLSFLISDTGCGIPLEKQPLLFHPFAQADTSTTRRFGGTGLGLYLSRKLAQILGGDVTLIDSQTNKGSTFEVTIDAEIITNLYEPAFASGSSTKTLLNLEGCNALIIEDSPEIQLLIRIMLAKTGAQIETANNGQEGVKMALEKKYDIIIMDVQMPILNGLDATRILREKGYSGCIIALTASALREEREKCLKAGCTDFLSKPFSIDGLYQVLKHHLQEAC